MPPRESWSSRKRADRSRGKRGGVWAENALPARRSRGGTATGTRKTVRWGWAGERSRVYSSSIESGHAERPKLSDPAQGTQRLQPRRSRRVRCSAWLGHVIRSLITKREPTRVALL